jgi:hypothetical protein
MKELPKSQVNPIPNKFDPYSSIPDKDKLISNVSKFPEFLLRCEVAEPGFVEKLVFVLKNIPGIIGILFKLINIYFQIRSIFMAENPKDFKTNLVAAGLATAMAVYAILLILGIVVPEGTQQWINVAVENLLGVAATIGLYFTGKKSPTYPTVK